MRAINLEAGKSAVAEAESRMPFHVSHSRRAITLIIAAVSPLAALAQAPVPSRNPAPQNASTRLAGPADLIIVNARVYTVDDTRPMVTGFAVRNGRILFA